MTSTEITTDEVEGDNDRYHRELYNAIQDDDFQRLKDILHELDQCKESTTKKEVLNR
ncbi:unnamed protein product, partial [Adineta steineri]